MKKSAFIFLCLFSVNTFAMAYKKTMNDYDNAQEIVIAHAYKNITDSQYYEKINSCSEVGNIFCTGLLGDYYFVNHNYSKAFNYLLSYFDNYPEVEPHNEMKLFFSSRFHGELGWLYQSGNGVLQNFEKALFHYRKATQQGNGESAYRISVIYAQKTKISYNEKGLNNKEYVADWVKMYAYAKVAKALGYKYDEASLFEFQEILSKKNKLNEANLLAEKICSSICSCKK